MTKFRYRYIAPMERGQLDVCEVIGENRTVRVVAGSARVTVAEPGPGREWYGFTVSARTLKSAQTIVLLTTPDPFEAGDFTARVMCLPRAAWQKVPASKTVKPGPACWDANYPFLSEHAKPVNQCGKRTSEKTSGTKRNK